MWLVSIATSITTILPHYLFSTAVGTRLRRSGPHLANRSIQSEQHHMKSILALALAYAFSAVAAHAELRLVGIDNPVVVDTTRIISVEPLETEGAYLDIPKAEIQKVVDEFNRRHPIVAALSRPFDAIDFERNLGEVRWGRLLFPAARLRDAWKGNDRELLLPLLNFRAAGAIITLSSANKSAKEPSSNAPTSQQPGGIVKVVVWAPVVLVGKQLGLAVADSAH